MTIQVFAATAMPTPGMYASAYALAACREKRGAHKTQRAGDARPSNLFTKTQNRDGLCFGRLAAAVSE